MPTTGEDAPPADVELAQTDGNTASDDKDQPGRSERQMTIKTASDQERPKVESWFPVNPEGAAPMTMQRYIFVLFEHPDACRMSKYVSGFVFLLILISSVSAWIETIPRYQYPLHVKLNRLNGGDGGELKDCVNPSAESSEGPQCGLSSFKLINTLCMICFLAEYVVRLVSVSGEDVSPWNDIELAWPIVQKKDARGQDAYDPVTNEPIYDENPSDNPYRMFYHKDYAPENPRMGAVWKTWYWFWKPLSLVDLLAVLPFVFEITKLAQHLEGLVSLRYFRLVRIFRVLKLQKQTIAVALFVNTIKLSAGPLMVLMFFVMMAIVVFGSIVYQVEAGFFCPPALDAPDPEWRAVVVPGQPVTFKSFQTEAGKAFTQATCPDHIIDGSNPDTCCGAASDGGKGCYCVYDMMGTGVQESAFFSTFISMWWVLTTITTVGYGDMFPTTLMGRFVGASAMILGVVGFAMPISIIGTAFEEEYHRLAANAGSIDKMLVDHAATSDNMKAKDQGYPSVPDPKNPDEGTELFESLVNACRAAGYQARDLADFANNVAKEIARGPGPGL